MLNNYLAAAFRNLARNKLHTAVNLLGLSIAFAVALLISLYVRDELSYDRWLPGYRSIYRISAGPLDAAALDVTPSDVAAWLKSDFAEIEAVTRLFPYSGALRHGDMEADEEIVWADANVFDVLPFPTVAGNLEDALKQPDSIVLTRKMARKYFGRDDPLGETLEIGRQYPFRVTAVIEDLPSNTHFKIAVLAPAHASFSVAAQQDRTPLRAFGQKVWNSRTYFRLSSNASIENVRRALPDLLDHHIPAVVEGRKATEIHRLTVVPIADIHLGRSETLRNKSSEAAEQLLYAASLVGLLVLVVAGVNFINLTTARAARRATEVGVRKAMGARKRNLVVQFLGESLICVAVAIVLALVLVEITLPFVNAFLDRRIVFDYWNDPWLLLAILGATLCIGMLAGLYPAFVLASFSPSTVLHSATTGGSRSIRQLLVIAQFSILIGLIVTVGVVYSQNRYALQKSLRQSADQYVFVDSTCPESLKLALASLAGVTGVACSLGTPQLGIGAGANATLPDGRRSGLKYTAVDFGYFEMFGFRPVAGRFFARDYATDTRSISGTAPEAIVINETALHEFGFSSPQTAIGQLISWNHVLTVVPATAFTGLHDAAIVGVVPDFVAGSARDPIPPAAFYVEPRQFNRLTLKVSGHDIAGTLRNVERVWKQSTEAQPFNPQFLDAHFRELYRELRQQAQLASVSVFLALCIACAGLFGLSAFLAEQRTKEIGIRKAMGAGTGDLMRLLVWQFTKPVLWANLIAWPVAGFAMNHWLNGFAYHIDLQPWPFIAATAAALLIALLTVGTHCYLVARAKPVTALRYE